jgi:outer membrane protein TolC
MLAFSSAHAQSSASLAAEREKTRARIDDIRADVVRDSDTAMTLGSKLSPRMVQSATRMPVDTIRSNVPVRPDYRYGFVPETPQLIPPPPERMARRAAPEPKDTSQPLVFTPDFSRQILSFAQISGKDIIDLPRLEDQNAPMTVSNAITDANTWGLADIVAEGLVVSPTLVQALADQDAANQRARGGRADWFPTLSVRATAGSISESATGVGNNDFRNHTLRLTQPVFNPVLDKNLDNLRLSEKSQQLRTIDSMEAVAVTLTQATVNLAATRLTINFADQQETQLINVLRYLEARTQAGATSQADLERARTRVLAAKQTRLDQQAAYKSSLFELERLIEQSPLALRLPSLNDLPPLPRTQAELRDLVRQNSAVLQALQLDVDSQQALVAAQKAKLLPTFGLSAERDVQKNILAQDTAVIGVSRLLGVVTWQASLGGKELYQAKEAEAELFKRKSKLEEEMRRIDTAVESDFSSLQSVTLRLTSSQSEQRAAQAVVDAVQEQLKSGRLGNLLEALDATDRLFSARSRQLQALQEQFTAQANLLKQMGQLSRVQATQTRTANADTVK